MNRSFHFSNHFSVFGRILAAKASGAKKTKTIIIACRAAKIIKATTAEYITAIKAPKIINVAAPLLPAVATAKEYTP